MPTYEMLWDCSSCGTEKLLGKTHRRCPHCGAPQDPTKRYFPPEGQEVAVEGHVFVGVDWRCAACETPNSRAADFCVNCGNPRDGNAPVKLVADAPAVVQPAVATTTTPRRWPFVVAGVVVLLVVFAIVAAVWKKEVTVVVDAHVWTRSIDVERLDPRSESAWCDGVPSGAYSISRSREVRSHRDVPDGQTCSTSRSDNGDGTFSTHETCRTKYRSEPIYDDKCHFTIDRWGVVRTPQATGGLAQPRTWPTVTLGRTGNCRGCEREGGRREELTVALHDLNKPDHRYSCVLDDARWRGLRDQDRRKMKVRVIGGGAVCDSLR
jgi:hypothetical protein